MASLAKYLRLIKQYPGLVINPPEPGIIEVITDPKEIRRHQRQLQANLKSQGKPAAWLDIGLLVDDPWFYVIRDLVRFPNGRVGGYIRFIDRKSLEGGFGVVIMVVQGENVLVLKHFRHDDRRWYLEFPRGFGEPGLTAEENARKELEEEIGVAPLILEQVGVEEFNQGGTAYFIARIPEDAKLALETGEAISRADFIPRDELEAWIKNGKFDDLLSIKTFLLARMANLA